MRNCKICKPIPTVSSSLIVLICDHKYTGDCWAQESAEDATEVTTSEIRTVNTGLSIGVRAGGAGGLQPPKNFGQPRFFGQQEKFGQSQLFQMFSSCFLNR